MTTTTGGAAGVLDWLEEWLQTEWPELDVACTSVTEQWTTIAVVGPQSRQVVARLAPDLDVSNEAFAFMTFRETTLASGVPARICRDLLLRRAGLRDQRLRAGTGCAVWEQVYAAGADLGITPYGTETMHVLRAEKGYPIVGQDTDGTVTPQDAGMDWMVYEEGLHRQALLQPPRHRPHRPQAPGGAAAGGPHHPAARGHAADRPGSARHPRATVRCRCSAT